jgi:hypothetical protein
MLTLDETRTVTDYLAVAIAQVNDFRGYLSLAILDTDERSRFLRVLPLQLAMAREAAEHTIALCLGDRWTAEPSWMESVIIRMNMSAQRQQFDDIINRIRGHIDPNPDPFASTWLSEDLPFFDRRDLRLLTKVLLTSQSRPVLRINGPDGAGRSYTLRIIGEWARSQAGETNVAAAQVPVDAAEVYQLIELVEQIAIALQQPGKYEAVPEQRNSVYPSQLARWVLGKAMAKPGIHVIVIEGAGVETGNPDSDEDLNKDIRLFLTELAQKVCEPAVRQRVRLVLINYHQPLSSVLSADMDEESVQDPSHLSTIDLLPCMGELNARRVQRGKQPLQAELPAVASEILARAPPTGKMRLLYVHEQLRALLRSA